MAYKKKAERQIKEHMESVMDLLGIERTKSNKGTPARLAKMWVNDVFLHRNGKGMDDLNASMTLFDIKGSWQLIVVKGIEFSSMCEHHWLPFSGKADIGYVPQDKILGLSKFPRVVEYFSRKPQLQERLTDEVGNYLLSVISPSDLFVRVEASHTCVACRGIRNPCSTVTYFEWHRHKKERKASFDDFIRRL